MAALSLCPWICLAVVMAMWNTLVGGQRIVGTGIFILGKKKSLVCSHDSTQGVVPLQWSYVRPDGTEQVITGAISTVKTFAGLTTVTSRYELTVAAADDNRMYYCRINGSREPDQGTSYVVTVFKYPDKPIITGPTTVAGGTNATWICVVDGAAGSPPKVTWRRFRNDSRVPEKYFGNPEDRPYKYSPSENLIIHNITRTLTLPITVGTPDFKLTCRADQFNTGYFTNTTISVTVSFRPKVTVSRTNYTVTTSNNVILACSVEASPSASIKWYKDGVALNMGSHYMGATPVDPSLIINRTNKTDAGVYICSATNDLGSTNASAGIKLVVRYGPTVTYSQNPVPGVLNSQVIVSCVIDAVPPATTINWYRISGTPEIHTLIQPKKNPSKYSGGTANNPSLTIKKLDTSDEGQYQCMADNDVGRGEGGRVRVEIHYRPQITVEDSLTSSESQSVNLTCSVDANPEAMLITWYKGGQVLNTSDSSRYSGGTAATPNLTILSVVPGDADVYYCVAVNSVGSTASNSTNLTVLYLPIITVSQSQIGATAGANITLTVSISASPALDSVQWRHLDPSSSSQVTLNVTSVKYGGGRLGSPSLQIHSVASSDAGTYTVLATNAVGTRQASITLVVSSAPTKPTVTFNQTGYEEGEGITLTCSSTSIPSPQYKWYHEAQVVGTSSTLSFATASPQRAGQYRCEASNTVGTASTSVPVIVFYAPRAGSISNVTAKVGETVTLTCAVSAYPPPHAYIWKKDGVTQNPSSKSDKLTKEISSSDDFGRYECQAFNSRGSSSPIPVYVFKGGNTGQSTEDTGLSTTTLILIIIICIVLLIIIVLIIIYCCVSGRCRKLKKDNNVSPSVQAAPPPPVVPASEKPAPSPAASTPNGHVASVAPPDSGRARNGHVDTKGDNPNKTGSLGHGMSISVPGLTPRPYHLPPLGQNGVSEEAEPAQDDKHKKKRRRRRHQADAAPQDNLQV